MRMKVNLNISVAPFEDERKMCFGCLSQTSIVQLSIRRVRLLSSVMQLFD